MLMFYWKVPTIRKTTKLVELFTSSRLVELSFPKGRDLFPVLLPPEFPPLLAHEATN
jgi:hypothetical protein